MPTPVGRDPLPREVLAGHQRERVLAAAVEVFAKRGYQGTTVDHIVSSARIGVGSFYSQFDGKEACFLAVYDQIVAEARERIKASQPAGASWSHATCLALAALLEAIAAAPLRARVVLVEAQSAGPAARARLDVCLDEFAVALRAGRECAPSGAKLPGTLEEAIVGGVVWLLQQRLLGGEQGQITALYPELVGIVLEPYLGEAEARRQVEATRAAGIGAG